MSASFARPACAFVLGFLTAAAPAVAGPLAPTKASQLVVARAVTDTPCPLQDAEPNNSARQIDAMTTVAGVEQPFVIPPRQVFVITSFHLEASGVGPGQNVGITLFATDGTSAGVLGESIVMTDAGGTARFETTLSTGAPVREGRALCIASSIQSVTGTVTGFFTKDK